MRWIGVLYGRVKAGLAATSGVHTHEDALKLIMSGADVVHLCSALLHPRAEAPHRDREGDAADGWRSTSTSRSRR